MSKKLVGTLIVRNGIIYDYSFIEAIKCLEEFCDQVMVLDIGSSDGTYQAIDSIQGKNISLNSIGSHEWDIHGNKERLSYFTNVLIEAARDLYKADYVFNLQADECLHEDSYDWVRRAIETGTEGFVCKRINLWETPYKQLNVPQHRKPCSTEIVRLAKSCYRAYDDAESLAAPCVDDFVDKIRIFHTGFVRRREVMKSKIVNMQCNVFGMENYDPKLDQCEVFNPRLWFGPEDLVPISEPLPGLIQKWAAERVYDNP